MECCKADVGWHIHTLPHTLHYISLSLIRVVLAWTRAISSSESWVKGQLLKVLTVRHRSQHCTIPGIFLCNRGTWYTHSTFIYWEPLEYVAQGIAVGASRSDGIYGPACGNLSLFLAFSSALALVSSLFLDTIRIGPVALLAQTPATLHIKSLEELWIKK